MTIYEYGNPDAETILIQPVDDHDLTRIEREITAIRELTTGRDFRLIAVKVDRWNQDLSPWEAPAVFGNERFDSGAGEFLASVLELCSNLRGTCYIGGYSLAGLFSLWAAYQTDVFQGVAAASPSIWFPGFLDYMKTNEIKSRCVYLSLGDREERTGNPVLSRVGDCIREGLSILQESGVNCTLEWNHGNHFKDPDLRTAKAFAWVMQNGETAQKQPLA